MKTVKLNAHGTNLASRKLAKKIRETELMPENGEKIVIDFSNIETASNAFLDELVGIIIATKGFGFFNSHYRIANTNDYVKNILKSAISYRIIQAESAYN